MVHGNGARQRCTATVHGSVAVHSAHLIEAEPPRPRARRNSAKTFILLIRYFIKTDSSARAISVAEEWDSEVSW